MPITKQQLYQVLDTVESLESKLKEQAHNDKHAVYNYQPQQLPERPVKDDDEFHDIKWPFNPHHSPLSNQRPLTLQQSFKKPMVHMNLPQRRPDLKHRPEQSRRPPHKSYGPPQRMPYVPSGSNIQPFKKTHLNKNGGRPLLVGNTNRFEHHVSPRPTSPQPRPTQTQPRPTQPQPRPTPPQPKINHLPMNIQKIPNKNYQHKSQQAGVIIGKPINSVQPYINLATAGNPHVFDRAVEPLNIPETNVIGVHVVKSQITLPSQNDAPSQSFQANTQGQIILGKPMENPIPMDQQMIQTAPKVISVTPSYTIYPETHRIPAEIHRGNSDIKSSDFIGEKPDPVQLSEPAVNTGFKPDSIVVESGFRPIIREPLMASEDRITDYLHEANRREDTNMESDYEEEEGSSGHTTNHILSNIEYKPITQHFEPMFIPSPPDTHSIQENEVVKNPLNLDSKEVLPVTKPHKEESKTEHSNVLVNEITKKVYTVSNANVKLNHVVINQTSKDVFPKNHAKEDRPQPVYHQKDSSLFSVLNLDKDTPDEMMIAADTVDTHYLPPYSNKKTQKPALTFTSYDGKTISAETLTDIDEDSTKLSNKSKLLMKTPQVGPYRGDLPEVFAEEINKKSVQSDSKRVTNLKLVNTQLNPKEPQELQAQASDIVTDFLESLFNFENVSKDQAETEEKPVGKEADEQMTNDKEEEEYYEDEENEEEEQTAEQKEEPKSKTRRRRGVKNNRLHHTKGYLNTNWQRLLLS